MTFEEAQKKVTVYLDERSAVTGIDLMIDHSSTLTESFGWVFIYNSRKFLETKNHNWGLGGNAPLIVDRLSGQIVTTGTAYALETYLDHYRKHRSFSNFRYS